MQQIRNGLVEYPSTIGSLWGARLWVAKKLIFLAGLLPRQHRKVELDSTSPFNSAEFRGVPGFCSPYRNWNPRILYHNHKICQVSNQFHLGKSQKSIILSHIFCYEKNWGLSPLPICKGRGWGWGRVRVKTLPRGRSWSTEYFRLWPSLGCHKKSWLVSGSRKSGPSNSDRRHCVRQYNH